MLGLAWRRVREEWRLVWAARRGVLALLAIVAAAVLLAAGYHHGVRLGAKNATIEFQRERLDDYGRRLDGASPEEAEARIAALQAEIDRLRAAYWPAFSEAAGADLVDRLKAIAPRPVLIGCISVECKELAYGFRDAFAGAGWPDIRFESMFGGDSMEGITVGPNTNSAHALKSAIEATTGLPVRLVGVPGAEAEGFLLVIGTRPVGAP